LGKKKKGNFKNEKSLLIMVGDFDLNTVFNSIEEQQ
jgi:hypothetical protein